MRIARVGQPGAERPAVYLDGHYYDVSAVAPEIDGQALAAGLIGALRAALAASPGGFPVLVPDRLGPPIARPPSVICIGQNYAAHAAESGSPPPRDPIVFLKPPNTVAGPDDPVRIPPGSAKTDWEVELGVVIGRRASYLASPADSAAHIAGFVLCNDVSERAFQIERSGGQWSKGKSAAGFCPAGPWLVTPDEVDHRDLRLRSWVNGEPRQDSSTADMIFDVDHLIWDLSRYFVLEPGDLILTGTPQGVALSGRFRYLRPGDVVELEIDGLGRQRQEFTA